jgi:hypothetical protein
MKKALVLVFVVLGLLLASCTESPVSFPPMNREVINSEEVEFTSPSKVDGLSKPTGNYILLRYFSTGGFNQQIYADLYLIDKLVCSWDLGSTLPWDRGEDRLFFTSAEGNCPNLDPRNGVIWYVNQNYANLTFQKDLVGEPKLIDTLSIWSLTSKGYTLIQ